ncbi:uncharacterized protein LOC120329027 [Styela clava]
MKFMDLYLLWSFVYLVEVSGSVMEEELQRHLFKDYNKHIRPSQKVSDVIEVDFFLTLLQLISIAEKSEEMTTSQYITLRWQDHRLKWNPAQFGGIKTIRLPSEIVWKPDLALSNNIDGYYDKTVPVNALLNHTGEIEWLPPAIYKSSCSIQVEYFPFDWQNCTLRFRSFTYSTKEIWLHSVYNKVVVDREAYTDNGEWRVIHCPIKVNSDPGDPNYQDITLYYIIQRKPLFYVINIIIPCVLISSLSVLVFYLPSGCSEKTNMSISVLLGLPVYLLLLAKRVPETSLGVPLIGAYLLFTMLSVTFSVIFSVIVLNIYHRSPTAYQMPHWVRTVFIEFLPPLLHMNTILPRLPCHFSGNNTDANTSSEDEIPTNLSAEDHKDIIEKDNENESTRESQTSSNRCSQKISLPGKIIRSVHSKSCENLNEINRESVTEELYISSASMSDNKTKQYFSDDEIDAFSVGQQNRAKISSEKLDEENEQDRQHFKASDKLKCYGTAQMDPSEIYPMLLSTPNNSDFSRRPGVASNVLEVRSLISTSCSAPTVTDSDHQEYFRLTCHERHNKHKSPNIDAVPRQTLRLNRADYLDISPDCDSAFVQDSEKGEKNELEGIARPDFTAEATNKVFPAKRNRRVGIIQPLKLSQRLLLKSASIKQPSQVDSRLNEETSSSASVNERRHEIVDVKKSRVKYVVHTLPTQTDECLDAVNFICQHVRSEYDYKEKSQEWQMVALVIDRLTFWIFLLVYISGSLYFALQALTNFPPDHPFVAGDPKYAECWDEHNHHYRDRESVI